MNLTPKAGTKLATQIASKGKLQSMFAGLVESDSAASVVMRSILPEDIAKALVPLVREGLRKGVEKEKDKKELAALVTKLVEPQLKLLGDEDMAMDLRGPSANKLYTFVAGIKVVDGKAMEKALPDLVKEMPKDVQALVKLNATKIGDVAVHQIDVHKKADADFKRIFGDNPLFIAFRTDAVIVACGEKGLAAVKEALALQPKAAKPVAVELSVARLAPLDKQFPGFSKAAEQLMAKEKGGDKVLLTLEGGNALKLQLDAKLTLIPLGMEMDKAKAKAAPSPFPRCPRSQFPKRWLRC